MVTIEKVLLVNRLDRFPRFTTVNNSRADRRTVRCRVHGFIYIHTHTYINTSIRSPSRARICFSTRYRSTMGGGEERRGNDNKPKGDGE